MAEVLDVLAVNKDGDPATEHRVKQEVIELCERFPIYPDLG